MVHALCLISQEAKQVGQIYNDDTQTLIALPC